MSGAPDDSKAVDEFSVIAELFAPLTRGFPGALDLTDDAALLAADGANELVVTMDAMVAGVHFLPDDPPDLIARKLVRVNLSDLAAKGARPHALTLAAAFPRDVTGDWLRGFAAGLGRDLDEFDVPLIGGDTVSTPGPLTLALTALGKIPSGRAILRSGARPGDTLWVSGHIGDGALGLRVALGTLHVTPADDEYLLGRYRLPQPRCPLGPVLVGKASAAMDISDGLVQDLGHLCRASGVGADVDVSRLPLSAATRAALARDQSLLASVLTGGDDYEVLFTAPANAETDILMAGKDCGVPVTAIGKVRVGQGTSIRDAQGREITPARGGWRHFGETESGSSL